MKMINKILKKIKKILGFLLFPPGDFLILVKTL